MAFLDKVLRWKKKPFGQSGKEQEEKSKGSKKLQSAKESPLDTALSGSGQFANVLTRPHISEKAVQVEALGQYVFEVKRDATKSDVAIAVKDLYGVMPTRVRIVSVLGKQLRFGRTSGATKHWKKAIIQLPKGKSIEVYKR
ncbi:MAG: 50S ribosomal protein L23 [bacterium]|nr:50S ribosomal protein L23 [bacterium]